MKNLFLINEDERNRILNLHETATKRQYLNEQKPDNFMPGQPDNPLNRTTNSTADTDAPVAKSASATKSASAAASSGVTSRTDKPNNTGGYGVDYIKQAQKLLGVVDDGKFGPKTLEALKTKLGTPSQVTTAGTQPGTSGTQTGQTITGGTTGGTQPGTTGTESPVPSSQF